MVSVDVSSKEFLQTGSAESKELQERVGQLRLQWDAAQGAVQSWREGLRQSLMQCQVRHPQLAPEAQAHVSGGSRYFYHRRATLVQRDMACVSKRVLDHSFPEALLLSGLTLALCLLVCCPLLV